MLSGALTMNYKLINKPSDILISGTCVMRIVDVNGQADNSVIPSDPANTDYQAYLAWVAEGNTAEAAD
mgnify:CR=1 FL=1